MICLEVRRRLTGDPHDGAPELRAHRAHCGSCARWFARHIGREQQLSRALALPVPTDLAARVLLRHELETSPARVPSRGRAIALAASFVLGFGVAGMLFWAQPGAGLDDDVLRHVEDLAYALEREEPVADATVAALFDWMGADVRGSLGEVRFANLCTIRDQRVAHLVIGGTHGPVTVLIMPGEDVQRARTLEDGSRRGRIVPYGSGALAVLSDQAEPPGRIEDRIRSTLWWRAVVPQRRGHSS